LIDRGYVYVAQPPLFKVKKGRSERYVKDEASLQAYLLDLALSNIGIEAGPQSAVLSTDEARALLEAAGEYRRLLDQLALRRVDPRVVDAALQSQALDEAVLADESALRERTVPAIHARFEALHPQAGAADFEVAPATGEGFAINVATRSAGVQLRTVFDAAFLAAPDVQRAQAAARAMQERSPAPYRLRAAGADGAAQEPESIASANALLQRVIELGQKGLGIQRYKGLGEMNAEQLADTTMEPSQRTLLQVKIEDAVEADDVFSTLMGDDVEPRREFIEENALRVQNLDV